MSRFSQQDKQTDLNEQPALPVESDQPPTTSAQARSWRGVKRVGRVLAKPFTGDKPIYKRPLAWLGLGVGGGAIALGYGFYQVEMSLPDEGEQITTYARPETLTIEAIDGTVLQQLGPVTHTEIEVEEVPEPVLQAFVASEDRRFYQHQGIDPQGLLRATWANLQERKVVEGGSTITQQLARIVYFDQERTLERKLREMRMAQKIEGRYDKDEILEHYLNLVYLGSEAYGVADAAWVYFSKEVDELTLAEAATLAGIAPAPSLYSPLKNPDAAKVRRNLVLGRMEADGFITSEEAASAIASSLELNPSPHKSRQRQAPYFTEYILEQLPKYVEPELLQAGGIVVETTLNPQWQEIAEATVAETIENQGKAQRFEQAALVALDPRNGEIKAMVGGNEFYDNQYNRVTQAQRQPGSTFKTFVYATAIATGLSPLEGYLDAPYVVDGYEPKNYSNNYRGWVSMRDALTSSLNVVAVRTLVDIGWNPIIEIAQKMGITSELKPTYSLALGASEVNLLELTSAYGTLANQGKHHSVTGIREIRNSAGDIIYEHDNKAVQALDEESSAITTWMLENVVNYGTGRPAQLGRPVAGKTGTSDDSRDLWFIGYIPQLVTGVWLGNDDNQPTLGSSGTAAATWKTFMAKAVEELDVVEFPERPENLDDREGIIAADPIEPEKSYYNRPSTTARNNTRSRPQRQAASSRRTRNRRSRPAPTNNTPARNSRPAPSNNTPARNSNPQPAATSNSNSETTPPSQPSRPTSQPATAPAPQPARPPQEATAPTPQLNPAGATAPAPAPPAPATAPAPAPASRPAPAVPIPVEPPPEPTTVPQAPQPAPQPPQALPNPPSVPK